MEHQTAASLLTDLVRDRLAPVAASEVRAHLESCEECREATETLRELESETREHGAAYFTPHPASEGLARYALERAGIATEDLAALDRHVQACPTCRREVEIARHAHSSAWQRAPIAAYLAGRGAPGSAWLRPALAVLAILLAYPAYLGVVDYPRERSALRGVEREAETLRQQQEGLARSLTEMQRRVGEGGVWGGAVQPLVLAGPERGRDHGVPAVTLRAGQPVLPVLIDRNLAAFAGREIDVTLSRAGENFPVWHRHVRGADLWDARSQLGSLLVPAAGLAPGAYRLDLRAGDGARPIFTAQFELRAARP